MSLTTEVLIFEASDAFRDDPSICSPAFDIVLKEDGAHAPGYYGKRIENPNGTGYIFLNWDNYEAHEAIMVRPSYQKVGEALKPSLRDGGKSEMYHVQFSAPTIALDKPVTEVTILTLKAPENREAVVEVLSKLSESTGKMLVFGKTREDENKYVVICGWETVQAHLDAISAPGAVANIADLLSLVNQEHHYHTALSLHSN